MMLRRQDVSGVSGVGHVADGVVFGDGTTVIRWLTEHRSTTVYAKLESAKAIHGHDGKTIFEFHDDNEGDTVWMCCLCFSDMDIPVNHCLQCGAGGSRVTMAKGAFESITFQVDSKNKSFSELYEEAKLLRTLLLQHYEPHDLALSVEEFPGQDGEPVTSVRSEMNDGRWIQTGGKRLPGESDDAYARRNGVGLPIRTKRLKALIEKAKK